MCIDWKMGEKYFATKLVDYDVAVNTGNWGWISGSGADAQPYFRIFNPWRQSAKHDVDAIYIKRWLPALKNVLPKHLHQWDEHCDEYRDVNYYKPMLDYNEQKMKAKKMYGKIFAKK
jgi:deoxyribodipyrimidine photo-lyase